MDESHYEGLLVAYKKQEIPLHDKPEELDKYISKYQDAIKRLENTKKRVENKSGKLYHNKIKLYQKLQIVSTIREKTDLIWKEEREKQKKLCESKIKVISAGEKQHNKLQDVLKDLKQLDTQYQQENISTKIKEYQNKTNDMRPEIAKLHDEYKTVLSCAGTTAEYEIPPTIKNIFKSKGFANNSTQIEEIRKIKQNIKNFNAKAQELAQQL